MRHTILLWPAFVLKGNSCNCTFSKLMVGMWTKNILYEAKVVLLNILNASLLSFVISSVTTAERKLRHQMFYDFQLVRKNPGLMSRYTIKEWLMIILVRHFHTSHKAPYLTPLPPPPILHNLFFHFSRVLQLFQEKLKTMLMQFFFFGGGGANKVHYGKCESGV